MHPTAPAVTDPPLDTCVRGELNIYYIDNIINKTINKIE